jgi:hypothetical protein
MIGRVLRKDPNNPGKIAKAYNVTGRMSEEYTTFGLAKMYSALREDARNGAILFPSRIRDIERKLFLFETEGTVPANWIEEEVTILRTYFDSYYQFFFGGGKKPAIFSNKKSGKKRGKHRSIGTIPSIIELEKVGTVRVPMDFEYFENAENLVEDYESLGKALGGKEVATSDSATRFDCANGESVKLDTYLNRI